MPEVYVVTIPGGETQAWQCPYCSLSLPMVDEAARPLRCPAECPRCGGPMDLKQAKAFAEAQALKADKVGIGRPTVKV